MTSSPPTLALLTPRWGATAETFVRRHLTQIAPAHTLAITRDLLDPNSLPDIPRFHLRSIYSLFESPPEILARALGFPQFSLFARALKNFLHQHQPTAFLTEWLNFSAKWFPLLRYACPNARFIAHAHGYDVTARALASRRNLRLYQRLHHFHAIVTVSQLTKDRLVNTLQIPADKIHVIPCGVDIPDPISRNPNPPPDHPVTILCVGRMTPKKGQFQTLQAFAQARQAAPNLRLEFIGDGPTLPACMACAAEQQVFEHVEFYGSKPPAFVAERLRAADIFALHSLTAPNGDEEGLPVALLEAMAHALPIVSTLHAGIPEAVADNATGFLVPEHDTRAMAQHFITLAQNPTLRLNFGTAARARAAQLFSAPSEIQRLRALLFPESDPA